MHYIDLTTPFSGTMPVFPGDTAASLTPTLTVAHDGCADHTLTTGMHVGTHIDAPAHMLEGASLIDAFPLELTHTRGVVIDARTARVLDSELFMHASIEPRMSVVIASGWSAHFKTGTEYDFETMPLLTEDGARYLVEKQVSVLILDTPTPDVAPFPQHKILLSAGIYIVENAYMTEQLIGVGAFETIIAPLRLAADASPIRIYARVHGAETHIPLGRYKHYKGHEYRVTDIARHSETLEYMAVYSNGESTWVRPLSMFSEHVNVGGTEIPRFTYIGE